MRFIIIGVVVAVAFTLYSLVDAAMTDGARTRGVSKPVWVVLIVVLPVIGGILWFMIGKGATPAAAPVAPDDDPRFSAQSMSDEERETLRDLEQRLRDLDDETFPGEQRSRGDAAGPDAANTDDAHEENPGADEGPTQK